MLAGDTQTFTVVDSNGNAVTGVTWNSSNSDIASFNTTGLLTADNAGETTVTASYQGFTAQTMVTVYVAASFSTGTALWTSASVSGYTPGQLLPATPTGTNAVDLFSVDVAGPSAIGNGSDVSIRGLTVDGQLKWTFGLSNVTPAIGNGYESLFPAHGYSRPARTVFYSLKVVRPVAAPIFSRSMAVLAYHPGYLACRDLGFLSMPLFIRVGRSIQFPTASKSGFGSPLSTGLREFPSSRFRCPVQLVSGHCR